MRTLALVFALSASHALTIAANPSPVFEASRAVEAVRVLPTSVELTGAEASALVIVQRLDGEQLGVQLRAGLTFATDDPNVALWRGGRVHAVGDGATHLRIARDGVELARLPVTVRRAQQRIEPEFDAHVQSVLARQGCNSGACHGALAGKGGFRLSLRGYDSVADHFTITRQDRGRRIEPADPGQSLILAKPSMLLPHKGGLRLPEDSGDYHILARWIAAGAPGPTVDAAELQRVEVMPESTRQAVGDKQQLIVRAHYADGRIEDVTHWAKFSSADEVVARVDDNGEMTVVGKGKGAITVWFASRIAMASVEVPFATALEGAEYAHFQPANMIDTILLEQWQRLGLTPSPTCSDATFLRRACIDATGTLPTTEQVRQFLDDPRPTSRERLVDELLASEAYVDYWAYQWSDLLLVNGNLLRPDAVAAFYTWIREQVRDNRPWDQFARQIVLAKGESTQQGATNFYALHQDPESLTENTCQAFMGLSIGCAKCHNHPLEKWTNDQYYAMANMFARVRAKGWGGDARNGDGHRTLLVLSRGDLVQPSRGSPQPPAALDQPPIDLSDTRDRREVLAEWLTSPENRYFSRSIVNRVWANFMGVGLVESVDDLRASNPPSSARLLDALADYLIEQDYDLKALMRLIMTSTTYQLSSEATDANAGDQRFYCRYYPRRLMAEVLHDAVVAVTEVPTEFSNIEYAGADIKPTDFYPAGTSALELYDSAVVNYFLKTFGRHQRRITCDCERSDQPTVVQVLHLNNGDTLNEKLQSPDCVIARWLEQGWSAERILEESYLTALSRFPTAEEKERLLEILGEDPPSAEIYQDLLWSLMTSREFLFAH